MRTYIGNKNYRGEEWHNEISTIQTRGQHDKQLPKNIGSIITYLVPVSYTHLTLPTTPYV